MVEKKIIGVIEARMGSKRLPGKSLKKLYKNYNLIDYQGPAIDSEMFMPGVEWQRLRSNSLLRPSKGYNISIHLIFVNPTFR